ncbi:MAG: glycosyltransferase family protein [Candidatus Micrarchaeia archaeon]
MRVHFMINGFGLGHVYRSLPIVDQLKNNCEVSISSFGRPYEVIIEEGYENVYTLPEIGEIFTTKDSVNISKSLWQNIKRFHPLAIKKITDIILATKPDVLVVDGYILGLFVGRMLRKRVINIANCTNLWYVFPKTNEYIEKGANFLSRTAVELSNMVLIPDFSPPFTVSAHNLLYFSPTKFTHVGPTALLTPAKKKDMIFISMGGSSVKNTVRSDRLQKWVNKIGYDAVVGDGQLCRKDAEKAISQSRAIITHGGHTTIMSSISAGTPVICIPTKNYTERINNAKGVERIGAGIMLDPRWICQENVEMGIEIALSTFVKERVALLSRIAHKSMGNKKAASLIVSD